MFLDKTNTKTYYLTVLRALATIAVITMHIGSGRDTAVDNSVRSIFTAINVWCVPIFFMISGALFLSVKKDINIKHHTHKVFHLLVIVLVWGWLYNFSSMIIISQYPLTKILLLSIKMTLVGDVTYGYHLWYLYTVIGLYCIIPILKRWFDCSTKKEHYVYLAIFTAFSIIIPSVGRIISDSSLNIWNGSFQYFCGYVVFCLLGALLHRYNIAKRYRLVLTYTGITIVIIYITVGCVKPMFLNKYVLYKSITSYVLSTSIFLTIKNTNIKNKIGVMFIDFIAENSLSIYLVHVIVIQLLRKMVGVSSESAPLIISLPLLTIVVLIVSIFLSSIGRKIPIMNCLIK